MTAGRSANATTVPAAAAPAISAALGRDEAAYHVVNLRAANPQQRFTTSFKSGAVAISSGGATLALRPSALGRPGAMSAVAAAAPQAGMAGVSYAHAGLREWYANGPLGLEQGFTVLARPRGANGPLTLSIAFAGSLRAALHGQVIRFSHGATTLAYGGLRATDATGRQLPAHLALGAGRRFEIVVDDRGAAYPVRIDPYVQQGGTLTGAGEVGEGFFGLGAAISPDGRTIIVGAPQSAPSGVAYVFTLSGSSWTQQAALTLAKAPTSAYFGDSEALSTNGDVAIIGAPNAGEVAVFTRSGSTWTQSATIVPRISVTGFGGSVALSNAGTEALIGDNGSDTGTNVSTAIVYNKNADGAWIAAQTLSPSGEDNNGSTFYEMHVALSGDGSTALLGNGFDQSGAGSAWVFALSGSTWTQQGGRLIGSGAVDAAEFGGGVALSSDGNTAAIGAPADNCNAGAAYIFARTGSSWSQQGSKFVVTATPGTCPSGTGGGGPTLGDSVALSADGNTALFGGGEPAVFTRSGTTWSPYQESGIQGGLSVGLSADGTTLLASCPGCSSGVGLADVYEKTAPIPIVLAAPPTLTLLKLKHHKVKHGHAMTIEFTLSAAGDVVVNFEHISHKHGHKTLTLAGSVTLSGASGANSFKISDVPSKPLKVGSYQLQVFTESGSQHSATQTLSLTIKP